VLIHLSCDIWCWRRATRLFLLPWFSWMNSINVITINERICLCCGFVSLVLTVFLFLVWFKCLFTQKWPSRNRCRSVKLRDPTVPWHVLYKCVRKPPQYIHNLDWLRKPSSHSILRNISFFTMNALVLRLAQDSVLRLERIWASLGLSNLTYTTLAVKRDSQVNNN